MCGERFGRLVVIERVANNGKHAMWKCKCACGNDVLVTGTNLRKGFTKSCGCLSKEKRKKRLVDLTGERFGRLVVIERVPNNNKRVMWKCKCDCGNITIVDGAHLKDGHTKSCGCLNRDIISRPFGEAAFNQIIYTYKKMAEKTGREFSLSEDEFRELILADCFYCGKKPSLQYHHGKRRVNGSLIYNGIDRIDNSKGYVQGNVRTCCRQCNIAKHHYTEEEFKMLITAIYKHLNLGEQM
jgi:hypothetical protein